MTGAQAHINAQDFKVTSDGSTNKFTIEASTGNTVIEGTLDVSSDITGSGDVQGAEIRATNGLVVTGAAAHVNAQMLKVTSDGSTAVFSVAGDTGNTIIGGTLDVTSAATVGGLEVNAAEAHINGVNLGYQTELDPINLLLLRQRVTLSSRVAWTLHRIL